MVRAKYYSSIQVHKFVQYVQCSTRRKNTLDHVYSNLKQAYRAVPLPHLGTSDHLSLLFIPAYVPLRKKSKPAIKTIKTWPEGALSQLQDCFVSTEWSIFEHLEYTETVLFYIKNCTDNVTVDKHIRVYTNQKPWMSTEVQSLLSARNTAYKSGDRDQYSVVSAELWRGIITAKEAYKKKVVDHLTNNNSQLVWQGLQNITNYKGNTPATTIADTSLAEELNHFFAHFEATRPHTAARPPQTSSHNTLTLQEHQVRKVLKAVDPCKAAGPDGVLGKVLRACADQLAGVLTRIFNLSLTQATIPPCLKSAFINPVPKKPAPNCFSDYGPIALTSVVMKCFERLILHHIMPASLLIWIHISLLIEQTDPQRTPSLLPFT